MSGSRPMPPMTKATPWQLASHGCWKQAEYRKRILPNNIYAIRPESCSVMQPCHLIRLHNTSTIIISAQIDGLGLIHDSGYNRLMEESL